MFIKTGCKLMNVGTGENFIVTYSEILLVRKLPVVNGFAGSDTSCCFSPAVLLINSLLSIPAHVLSNMIMETNFLELNFPKGLWVLINRNKYIDLVEKLTLK